jgi:two-component system phosphate regulon response regulator OmpR
MTGPGAEPRASGTDGAGAHLLVVDDDARIRGLLQKFLMRQGFLVTAARDAAQARALLRGLRFDLVILDVMMPGEDGLSLARAIRAEGTTPVILLTARGEAGQRIEGLEAGADDYVVKPFEPRELVLRIGAVLRRGGPAPEPAPAPAGARPARLGLGALSWDVARGELRRGEEPVRLTQTEVALMRAFAAAPGRCIPRAELAALMGPPGSPGASGRAVDVQITRLRRKLEDDPRLPRHLHTVRGAGYRLDPDPG